MGSIYIVIHMDHIYDHVVGMRIHGVFHDENDAVEFAEKIPSPASDELVKVEKHLIDAPEFEPELIYCITG